MATIIYRLKLIFLPNLIKSQLKKRQYNIALTHDEYKMSIQLKDLQRLNKEADFIRDNSDKIKIIKYKTEEWNKIDREFNEFYEDRRAINRLLFWLW